MPKSRSTSKPKATPHGLAAHAAKIATAKAETNANEPPPARLVINEEDAVKNLEEIAGILTTMNEQLDRLNTFVKPALEPLETAIANGAPEANEELLSSLTAYEQQMLHIGLTLAKAARLSEQRKKARWLARDFRRLNGLSMKRRNTEFLAEQFKEVLMRQLAGSDLEEATIKVSAL